MWAKLETDNDKLEYTEKKVVRRVRSLEVSVIQICEDRNHLHIFEGPTGQADGWGPD